MTVTPLFIDVEATTHAKGNPFSRSNKLVLVGCGFNGGYHWYWIEYDSRPYGETLVSLSRLLNQAELLVGHNIKYDLNWLRRYLPDFRPKAVWDTQLFEYMYSHQTWIMPSLDDCLKVAGFEGKTDDLAERYWNKGVDTTEIAPEVLVEYNMGDVYGVEKLYYDQVAKQRPEQQAIFALHCQDLLVLEDMEHNGMAFDSEACESAAEILEEEFFGRQEALLDILVGPHPHRASFNLNSNDHLSAFLYGGSFKVDVREKITKQLKKGPKEVERWGKQELTFPRLVEPIEGTEREKEGYYLVNEDILKTLRPKGNKAKQVIHDVLELSHIEKLLSGYYKGIPTLCKEMDWPYGIVHGTYNQTVTRTGRSSCSKPNQQNFHGDIKHLFRSRYVN